MAGGVFDEIKGEGIKWLAVIAGLFIFVFAINAIMISIWILVIPVAIIALGWMAVSYWKANR